VSPTDWLLVVAAIGHATLAALAFARGGASPLARPLAFLCCAMFGWCFAGLAHHVTQASYWGWVDDAFTAISPPLALHLIVAFVGARRVHVRVLAASYLAFGVMSLVALSAFVLAAPRVWLASPTWAALELAVWVPMLAYGLALLLRHLATTADADEKARTRTMLAALGAGGALATMDLLDAAGGGALPRIGALGTLAATSLVAIAALRLRLFDRDLSVATALYVGALALGAAAAYLVVFYVLGRNAAALAFGATAVTVVVAAAARELVLAQSTARARTLHLAALGRISAQMTHDLKNPLAALVGAAQLLEGDLAPAQQREMARLVLAQAQRLRAVVEKFDRVARVEPVKTTVQVNELVARAAAAQQAGAPNVVVETSLAKDLAECDVDADLVLGALENLVRNAVEAMPGGGTLRLGTRAEPATAEGPAMAAVWVADTGAGMDARRAEQAFEDFFTTKATGSGLGLAFVRRVAVAHGGKVSLTSKVGEGTRVELRFPLAGPVAPDP
jgi:two-component system, NtrC family, sensor histidine kinase HydH